jgi:tetratricopeptide (TPR) repeat protein
MDEPPDIRRPNRRQSITELMQTVKAINARKLATAGTELIGEGKWQDAYDKFNEAAMLFLEMEDLLQRSNMLSLAGLCLYAMGKMDEARDIMLEAIQLKRMGHDEEGMATDLIGLGEILLKRGENEEPVKRFSEAIEIFKKLGIDQAAESAQKGLDKAKKAISASGGQ